MIEVYDDIVTEKLADQIEAQVTSIGNVWNYDASTITPDFNISDSRITESFQFRSLIKHGDMVFNEESYTLINEMCRLIRKNLSYNLADPYRAKYNLLPQVVAPDSKEEFFNTPHVDADIDHYVLLYYVNDSDGPTYIFNETKNDYPIHEAYKFSGFNIKETVHPKKGRFVLFSGDQYHTSSCPVNHSKRVVLNINFAKENVLL